MSDSGLQSFFKDCVLTILKEGLGTKKYRIWSGEVGNHLSLHNNLGLDVAVFEKSVLTPAKITSKYVNVPAKLVVEVDVNVELPDQKSDLFQEYTVRKVRRLFEFGTEKVVWIFTKSKMVMSATPDAPWQFYEWSHDVELIDGVMMNLARIAEEEGFNFDIA